MDYDDKKAVKRITKLIGYLSDLIIKEEDKKIPDTELLTYFDTKIDNLTSLRAYFQIKGK